MAAHCFFEQSGTFKNEFKKLGIDAFDYDILNNFGETDYEMDLFGEISKSEKGEESVFDKVNAENDVIIAFFPCTYFQENNALIFSGNQYQLKNKSLAERMKINIERHDQLNLFYKTLCSLVKACAERGIGLIVENPMSSPHYLSTYFVPPTITDWDRRIEGDYYKKPTQYWFFNREPKQNFIFEPIEHVDTMVINHMTNDNRFGVSRTEARSMIHPQYASRFIRRYILDYDQKTGTWQI